MTILIDNGHGSDTSGKRSPDSLFREYSYNREIACRVVSELSDCGYDARLLVPEIEDIPLQERCRRVNSISVTKSPRQTPFLSRFTSMHLAPVASGTLHQAGAHTPLRESLARIFSPLTFMKQHKNIWQGRRYDSTTARRSPILKATSMYFAAANVLQYSQKIYTRIAALTLPSSKAMQGRGLLLCST